MKVEVSDHTRKMKIIGADRLDTINLYIENFGPGQGRIVVECFGQAWSHYWSHMGEDMTIETFLPTCEPDYVARKLYAGHEREPDFDEISRKTGESITHECEMIEYEEEMSAAFGQDWRMDHPTRLKSDYVYLKRIVRTIKEALSQD